MTQRRAVRLALMLAALGLLALPAWQLTFGHPGQPHGRGAARNEQPSAVLPAVQSFQLAGASPTPASTPSDPKGGEPDLRRSFALRGVGFNKAGDAVVTFTDDSTYAIGKTSVDSLSSESLKTLLDTTGTNKAAYYSCVTSRKEVSVSKAPQDCDTIEALNAQETLP